MTKERTVYEEKSNGVPPIDLLVVGLAAGSNPTGITITLMQSIAGSRCSEVDSAGSSKLSSHRAKYKNCQYPTVVSYTVMVIIAIH